MRSLLCAARVQAVVFGSACIAESSVSLRPTHTTLDAVALTASRALSCTSFGVSAVRHLASTDFLPAQPPQSSRRASSAAVSSPTVSNLTHHTCAVPLPLLRDWSSAVPSCAGESFATLSRSSKPACLAPERTCSTLPLPSHQPQQQPLQSAGLTQLSELERRRRCAPHDHLTTKSAPTACRAISTSLATYASIGEPASPRHPHRHSQPPRQPAVPGTDRAPPVDTHGAAGLGGSTAPGATKADPIYNLPNAVSVARLLSGPVIGMWLLQGHYEAGTLALAISGASDWLDGFLARRLGATSVFGSYLDPLADKVLIGCVAGALLANGAMPGWLAAVVVGRDVLLVSGAFVFRLRGFGWRWPGREAFFRTADTSALSVTPAASATAETASTRPPECEAAAAGGSGVAFMRPLLISKANTALQLVLLGAYLTRGMYGWPHEDVLMGLELATATTTVASLAAYGSNALQGKLFK